MRKGTGPNTVLASRSPSRNMARIAMGKSARFLKRIAIAECSPGAHRGLGREPNPECQSL